ncbi:ead/Ea22-like family protein [Citrobacter cronae]|uniref:ead/Ea22-like family protein n=1 Tax=Citrobacter cronae TaxID=1748967 RepID=UPI00388CF537
MNNIDKGALREAADSVIQKYGSEWFETGRQLCTVHKSKIELIAAANPATVLALLDELEAAENSLIDSECHVAGLEEALRDKQALLETLDNSLCELLPGTQYMDPPDGGSVTPLEQVRRMVADYRNRIAELEARKAKPVMFIDGDISSVDADKLAAVIREFNEETETPAARMARIIRENPRPTNMCDMPAAGIGVKGE